MESQSEKPVTLILLRIAKTYKDDNVGDVFPLANENTHIGSTGEAVTKHPEITCIQSGYGTRHRTQTGCGG